MPDNVQIGMTPGNVQALLGTTGRHQFTVKHIHTELRALSYAFVLPTEQYYFIFQDDRLIRIVERPAFEWEMRPQPTPYNANAVTRMRAPVQPDARVQEALTAEAISPEELRDRIRRREREVADAKAQFGTSPSNFPAPIRALGGALAVANIPASALHHRRNRDLVSEFDPNRIRLGMTREDVADRFGEAIETRPSRGASWEVFGSTEQIDYVPPRERFSNVLVKFEDERVTGIFGNDFLPFRPD